MMHEYNCTDKYNLQALFVIDAQVDGSKYVHKTEYHCHDFTELSIITSGTVNYLIENENYTLYKGQVIIFKPGIYHKELLDKNSKCSELHIGINNVVFQKLTDYFDGLQGEDIILTLTKYEDEFMKCCEEIAKEQRDRKSGYSFVLKSLIMKLLVILFREIDSESATNNSSGYSLESREKKSIVNLIVKYLEENYTKEISLDSISKNMYLSPVYISKVFKEEMKDSPINYLIKIRLAKAKKLLSETKLPIKTVAKSVGYTDPYYFSKIFKKYYGFPPSKIREGGKL